MPPEPMDEEYQYFSKRFRIEHGPSTLELQNANRTCYGMEPVLVSFSLEAGWRGMDDRGQYFTIQARVKRMVYEQARPDRWLLMCDVVSPNSSDARALIRSTGHQLLASTVVGWRIGRMEEQNGKKFWNPEFFYNAEARALGGSSTIYGSGEVDLLLLTSIRNCVA